MYRKPSKKQLLFRRSLAMIVSIVAVLVIVAGTLLFILGYRLDSVGRLEQGALVQFDSLPTGALVTIDGVSTGSQTGTKRSLIAGEHTFMMSKTGYRPWERTLSLDAGTLTWLDYIRLVPETLSKQTVRSYEAVADVSASPDMQSIVVQTDASKPEFEVVDIRAQDIKTTVATLPEELLTDLTTEGVTHAYTLDEWDPDGRYLLVTHKYNDNTEWLVFDTDTPASSRNITRSLSISLSDVQFASTNGNVLYGLSDGVIRKLDLQNGTLSGALVSRVDSFKMYETSMFTYVGRDEADQSLRVAGLYRDGDQAPHIIQTAQAADVLMRADMARYYNTDYIAVSEGNQTTVYSGRYPSTNQLVEDTMTRLTQFTNTNTIDQLTFTPDGASVVARSGLEIATYELEHEWLHAARIETSQTDLRNIAWLDDAHFTTAYDGHLAMRDFDGTNTQVIMPIVAGFDATLSQNGRYIYAVNKTDETFRLERVKMILD